VLISKEPAQSYCLEFGGTIVKDQPGQFKAKNAPAPSSCSIP